MKERSNLTYNITVNALTFGNALPLLRKQASPLSLVKVTCVGLFFLNFNVTILTKV